MAEVTNSDIHGNTRVCPEMLPSVVTVNLLEMIWASEVIKGRGAMKPSHPASFPGAEAG